MAFDGLSARLQEITRKLSGKARISEGDLFGGNRNKIHVDRCGRTAGISRDL